MQSFLRPSRRAAILGGAGLALVGAVGIGGVAFADSAPTPSTTQSPATPGASGAPAPGGTAAPGGPAIPGPRAHAPHIGGSVLTVDGSTVTVKDRDGFTRTVHLSGDVTVTKDAAASSSAAIVKGVWIEASGTVDSNGTTLDATEVRIGQPTPPKGGPGALRDRGAHPGRPAGGPVAPKGPAASGAPAAPKAPATPGATAGAPSAAPSGS